MPRFDVCRNPNARAAAAMLRNHVGRLGSDEQLLVQTSIDFMLRGY